MALLFSSVMSRLAGLLILVLGSAALADDAQPPADPPKTEEAAQPAKSNKFPLKVVKILSESEQALLFDKNRGRHVLVEVGDTVGDYLINAIDEDGVTLGGEALPVEVLLAAPDSKKRPAKAKKTDAKDKPEDPYADATPAKTKPADDKAPTDPYAEDDSEKPIRAVTWGQPSTGGEGEKSTTSPFAGASVPKPSEDVAKRGSMSKTESPDAPADPYAETKPVEKPVVAKPVVETKAAANAPTKLARKDVHVALADFGALMASIDASFGDKGLELVKVAPNSVFAKAGLQTGDVITAIDGKPFKNLDDAADLYARAGTIKTAKVDLVRAGKPQTLKIQIQ